MQKKKVLWIILITLLTTAMTSQISYAPVYTQLGVTPITIEGVPIGSYFQINITVDDVTALFGYGVFLRYNTTVLTAMNYTNLAYLTYAPFNDASPSAINETAGWISVTYSCPMAENTGITTSEPIPLTRIWFRVDANGTSPLDIEEDARYTTLADIYGHAIKAPFSLIVSDGIFSNVGEIKLHDIALTSVAVNATSAKPGDLIVITIRLRNDGSFNETFPVNAKYNYTAEGYKDIGTKTVPNLLTGANTTIIINWNTAGVAEGKHVVTVQATLINETNTANNIGYSDVITLKGESTGWSSYYIYIAAAIVIIAVVAVVIYVLRRRK